MARGRIRLQDLRAYGEASRAVAHLHLPVPPLAFAAIDPAERQPWQPLPEAADEAARLGQAVAALQALAAAEAGAAAFVGERHGPREEDSDFGWRDRRRDLARDFGLVLCPSERNRDPKKRHGYRLLAAWIAYATKVLILSHWPEVERVAVALLSHGRLDGEAVRRAARPQIVRR